MASYFSPEVSHSLQTANFGLWALDFLLVTVLSDSFVFNSLFVCDGFSQRARC